MVIFAPVLLCINNDPNSRAELGLGQAQNTRTEQGKSQIFAGRDVLLRWECDKSSSHGMLAHLEHQNIVPSATPLRDKLPQMPMHSVILDPSNQMGEIRCTLG